MVTVPSRAAQATPASKKAELKRLFKEGVIAYGEERYIQAVGFFKKAYKVSAKAKLLYNIAAAYEAAGKEEQAYSFYERYLKELWDAPNAVDVRATMERLKISFMASYPSLTVNSTPAGAAIYLDERGAAAAGTTPLTFKVAPGRHTIIVEKEGWANKVVDIEMVKGTPQALTLNLEQSIGAGEVLLSISPPGAQVMLNGESVGKAPFSEPLALAAGMYWATVTAPEYKPWTGSLLVTRDKRSEVVVRLEPTKPPPPFDYKKLSFTLLIASGSAISAGIISGLLAQGLYDDLAAQQDRHQTVELSAIERGELYVEAQQVLLGLGVGCGIAGGIFYLLGRDPAPSSSDAPSLTLAPLLGNGSAGVSASLRF